jgi:threonine dehydrogenase-like Zn-dependent dehydrogenase
MKALVYDIKPLGWLASRLLQRFRPDVLTSSLNGIELREIDPPALPGDDWVRVRTLMGGICGTDVGLLAQKQPPDSILQAFGSMPMLLGHENLAQVTEVGATVDDGWVGKRVLVEPTLSCRPRGIEPVCDACARGQFGACESFGAAGQGRYKLPAGTSIGYNARTGGSYGEQFVAHESQLVAVPDELPDEQALLVDPLAVSVHSVLRADLARARRVLVYGTGVLGLGVIDACRAAGFEGEIHALDRCEYLHPLAEARGADRFLVPPSDKADRYELIARQTGASLHRVRFGNLMLSGGYDVLFDCAGATVSFQDCLKWAAAGGQIVVVGTASGGKLDLTPVWFRELTVIGSYGRSVEHPAGRDVETYPLVLDWLTRGKLDSEGLLTHTFPLHEYREAMSVSLNKARHRAIKVAFDFRENDSAANR